MKKKFSQPSNSVDQSQDIVSFEDDIYSQVMGSEKSSLVRNLGLNLTPSNLWDPISRHLKAILEDNKVSEKVKLLEDMKIME